MNASISQTNTIPGTLLRPVDLGRTIAIVVGFSLLTALSAQISFHLPFTPVPITAQTFAVLLTGAVLGSRLGAITMFAYLAEGASGLPFFSNGAGGPAYLLSTVTLGYLLSYPAAAFVTGWLAERGWDRKPITAAMAMAIGSVVILLSGWAWFAYSTGNPKAAFVLGVAPFLVGDVIKIALAAAALPLSWRLVKTKRSGNQE